MDYDKALREGKLDERMAYAWLKSGDPTAKQKLKQYAEQQGKQSIYDLFPGKRGETVVKAPEPGFLESAQNALYQMGLPVDHSGTKPSQISPGSRLSLADLENQYGSLDLERPATLPDKELVTAQDLKSESIRPDFRDPKVAESEKNKTPAPAPAPAPAQKTLDNVDNGTSAAATAAYMGMPDYLPRPGSNTKMPNRQKQALITEANRRQRNEIGAQIKQENAAASRAQVDEVLNANNDKYRTLYANSSNDRTGEDWDAMSRDQKVQLIKNYNINMGRKSMEKPEGSKPAAVRPDGSPVSQKYYDKFFNNPDVPDFGNLADRTPESMVPVYGPEGVVGYNSRSETAKAAKEYAKNSMRNNPRSTTANVFSGDMQSLYPTLPVNRFKNKVDFDEAEEQKKYNPFV